MSAIEWSVQALRAFPGTLSAFVETIPAAADMGEQDARQA